MLTSKQVEFLRKLIAFKRANGVAPTFNEMMAFGPFKSPRSVSQYLDVLVNAGLIERGAGARNIRVTGRIPSEASSDQTETVNIPLIGHVAAGTPITAEENVATTFPVSTRLARKPHRYFLLKVKGNSMNAAGINPGDMVLVRQQTTFLPSNIVVALIDGEATIKRIRPERDLYILEPQSTDPSNKAILVDRDFLIQGVVIATIPREGQKKSST